MLVHMRGISKYLATVVSKFAAKYQCTSLNSIVVKQTNLLLWSCVTELLFLCVSFRIANAAGDKLIKSMFSQQETAFGFAS